MKNQWHVCFSLPLRTENICLRQSCCVACQRKMAHLWDAEPHLLGCRASSFGMRLIFWDADDEMEMQRLDAGKTRTPTASAASATPATAASAAASAAATTLSTPRNKTHQKGWMGEELPNAFASLMLLASGATGPLSSCLPA